MLRSRGVETQSWDPSPQRLVSRQWQGVHSLVRDCDQQTWLRVGPILLPSPGAAPGPELIRIHKLPPATLSTEPSDLQNLDSDTPAQPRLQPPTGSKSGFSGRISGQEGRQDSGEMWGWGERLPRHENPGLGPVEILISVVAALWVWDSVYKPSGIWGVMWLETTKPPPPSVQK